MLQHSVSIRLRSMTAHHFVLRQWKSLVQLLESALLRQVSLTSLQAVAHGDLDILLTITGGVELAVLSEALQSAGLSGANWSCDCHNGALSLPPEGSDTAGLGVHSGHRPHSPGWRLWVSTSSGVHAPGGGPWGLHLRTSLLPSISLLSPPRRYRASIHWEELVAIVVAILIVSCLVLVFVLYRRCHRISPGNRVEKSELNHVIKRTSKLSNLQVTQPSRPTSYTCSSNNEVFSAVALNNAERGTAESDNVPPDYRRNLMSPHHKINNDLKQTADIPLHQVIPAEDDTRTIGGFHWDCTEWLQNGDVHTTILGDSSSYHSNDSCLTGDPARELATLDTKLKRQEDQMIPYGFPRSRDICL
ncbi:uncharacterized protein LOC124358514 [Homalodisca vitripennis]|uniref:uncharacterized protein LOC124358514 n=1 Tax=Homalodisca vitripennis TaxID=197043 RepID=UPI001EEB0415|nr:uncharacterized protein LOC124358514 [Homalodisca vitripennis]